MWSWIDSHPELVWWTGVASVLTLVSSLVMVPLLLCRMPADYFVRDEESQGQSWVDRHPILRWTFRIAKNLLGASFVILGLAMLILPGQGILTMLLGIMLLDLPGKRRLEVALLRRPHVSRAINWLRARGERPPLLLPDGVRDA